MSIPSPCNFPRNYENITSIYFPGNFFLLTKHKTKNHEKTFHFVNRIVLLGYELMGANDSHNYLYRYGWFL